MLNLDWNINQKHKLAVRYRYTKASQVGPDRSSNTLVNFSNSGQTFPSVANNGSIELIEATLKWPVVFGALR